jgi:hypothetical protein
MASVRDGLSSRLARHYQRPSGSLLIAENKHSFRRILGRQTAGALAEFVRTNDIVRRGRLRGLLAFHDCQDVAALLGDTPSTIQPLNETLGENR